MNKLLLCFGTRPEWLKIKPLISVLPRKKYSILFTGQHIDLIENVEIDHEIKIENKKNRLDSVIISCLNQFPEGSFSGVVVQGDTASAYACALAAYNRGIDIFYLEAGLRSYDLSNPYPEEAYRQMISRISSVNFCPTSLSRLNLISEKVSGENYVVGNTVLDNLLEFKKGNEYGNVVLVTMHRRENHHIIKEWFTKINELAVKNPNLNFCIPLHPNPNVYKHRELLKNLTVMKPLDHSQFMKYLTKCKFVITDSGGIQEEGSFFNKKVIVCRKTTERPEGLGTGHLYLCKKPQDLEKIFEEVNNNYIIEAACPYGDGFASEKIYKILRDKYKLNC
tara:strand:+ start:6715 stop:7722 length:1008 start_codon:yes stop_codon:yes gene_type:complete